MPISIDALIGRLENESLARLARDYVLVDETPFVFENSPGDYTELRNDLSTSLDLPTSSFTIVGSAKLGYSLSPDHFGRQFGDDSDVDVVVVDHERFDKMWQAFIDWDYRLGPQEGWRREWRRQRHEDVYWGWFMDAPLRNLDRVHFPASLRVVRDISNAWFDAFQSVGVRHAQLSGRKFSGRLYRTWNHAISYHADGLRKIRKLEYPPESN